MRLVLNNKCEGAMLSIEQREAIQAVGLAPETMAWMSEPPTVAQLLAPPPPRYAYERLSDQEWAVVSPHWPSATQANTSPRNIIDALLKLASTGCPWNVVADLAPPEAARLQYRRRLNSGVLATLADAVQGQLSDARVQQFRRLAQLGARWAR